MELMSRDLVLASASPRRKMILETAGFPITVHPTKVSENLEENLREKLTISEQIIEIARRKARAGFNSLMSIKKAPFIVIGADTLVILENEILGKPADQADAEKTLHRLSGRWHEVRTSIVIIDSVSHNETAGIESTRVLFKELSSEQIKAYVASGDPMDKAGSYGIQNLQDSFVEKLDGRLDNVIGLSLLLFNRLLKMQREPLH